jgi:hypothetical protein
MKQIALLFTILCVMGSYQLNAMEPNITSKMLDDLAEQVKAGSTLKKAAPINQAIQVAQQGIASSSAEIRDDALNLFIVLINRGHAVAEATQAAQKAVSSNNINTQARGLDLFAILVNKGQAYKEATKAALDVIAAYPNESMETVSEMEAEFGIKSPTIHTYAMRVLFQLAEKGQSIDAIVKIAQLAMKKGALISAITLFTALAKKGYALAPAVTAAQKIVDDFEADKDVDFIAFAKASVLLDELKAKKVKAKKTKVQKK